MKKTKRVMIGCVPVGGGAPVSVQSMTNTDTRNVQATVKQIQAMESAGCHIVRMSIYDSACAEAIRDIKKQVSVPLVADIHFDYRLALASIEAGIDKLRINPGNIGDKNRVKMVADAAKERGIPIRIGVNGGSLEKDLLQAYGAPTPAAMVKSAMRHVHMLEDAGFDNIVISVKHSNVPEMVQAYELLSEQVDYPLHLGVTEAGTVRMGTVRSAVGIGALLLRGIGDTIRVSLAGDPVREVPAGYDILRACGLYDRGVRIVACPTCGRTGIDVEGIALELEKRLSHIVAPLKVAVMGCVVNGPGEAKEADIGIAGARDKAVVFMNGETLATIPSDQALDYLCERINELALSREAKQ